MDNIEERLVVGWREWASLPELDVPMIKVKIDTGAKTSALHAFDIKTFTMEGSEYVSFSIHPIQENDAIIRACMARIVDTREIKSSNGLSEQRIVIRTSISIGTNKWPINITLTNRDIMKHRMLLGREAMNHVLVNPTGQFHQGRYTNQEVQKHYELELI